MTHFRKRSVFALLLIFAAMGLALAQDGQGNAVLTMGGDCSPGSGIDLQVRGCAEPGTRVFLVSDPELGPTEHPLGTFCVAFSEDATIYKGRVGPNGVAFFWLDDPIDPSLVGRTLYWQAAYFDPTAPNGLAITNCVCQPICPPDTTYSCRDGIGSLEGLLVVGPVSDFPVEGVFRIASADETLVELPFIFELPGPAGPVISPDGIVSILRITILDPCLENNEVRLAIQFCLDAAPLPTGLLPSTTIFSAEIDGVVTSRSIDTSCGAPIGVGIRTRPLILTCIEDCPNLDFETEDDFATPLVNGQEIASPSVFGNLVEIDSPSTFGATIYDSNVGGANDPGRDDDLLVNLGNLLIVQENGDQTVPGIFDFPDDDRGGGEIDFDFVRRVKPLSVNLADIDAGNQGVELVLTDGSARSRTFDVPGHWTTDIADEGGAGFGLLKFTTLDPQPGFNSTATAFEDAGFDLRDVVSLRVRFMGSGALDNLQICPTLK